MVTTSEDEYEAVSWHTRSRETLIKLLIYGTLSDLFVYRCKTLKLNCQKLI